MERYKNCTPKVDFLPKVKGEAKFTDDISFPDMLFAVTLRSTIFRGKIKSIKLPELPEDYYFFSAKDLKGENVVNIIFSDWPVFADGKVNFIGESIGIFVGKDKEILEILRDKTVIEYGEEAPIFDFSESYIHKAFTKGNYEEAKKKAVRVIKETFETNYQEQAYLENQGILAYFDEHDKLTLTGSMQCPFYIKRAVMRSCALKDDQVRVIQPAVGGAFGGKEHYPSMIGSQVACAALALHRPVKMCFERLEDMTYTTKRHPSHSEYEALIGENNEILGLKIRVKLNGGAYKGCSGVVLSRALIASANVYVFENLDVVGDVYMTNTTPTAAFRGFGSPQTIYAMEMFIHHIAKELGMDPLELQFKYIAKKGDITTNSGHFHDDIVLKELMEKAMEMSDYRRKVVEYAKPGCNKGIGMSVFLHGCGFTGAGESEIINGKVKLVKDENDHVYCYASSTEMGQGSETTLKRIVTNTLGIPVEQATMNYPDTDLVPDSGPTAASRTIIIVGFLFEKCAKHLKEIWKPGVRQEYVETYVGPEYIHWDEATMQGDAYPGYAWGVNIVEVEFDPITYQVSILNTWSTYDIGRAVDERIAVGQADGGLVQGLGYGYLETMNFADGRFKNRSLSDYIIPTFEDAPRMETEFID